MQTEQFLPVAVIAIVVYLIKLGGLSALALALRKLWKRLSGKREE